jgi:hypothetical protein
MFVINYNVLWDYRKPVPQCASSTLLGGSQCSKCNISSLAPKCCTVENSFSEQLLSKSKWVDKLAGTPWLKSDLC